MLASAEVHLKKLLRAETVFAELLCDAGSTSKPWCNPGCCGAPLSLLCWEGCALSRSNAAAKCSARKYSQLPRAPSS